MTTLAVAPAPSVRPVPWPRLAWVVWRRYRATLGAIVAVLALLACYLVIDGERMRSAYATYTSCTPARSARCEFAWQNFRDGYGQPGVISVVLLLLPGIVGAFAGAPILARELETGTFRYAWTQGVGRMRWSVAVLVSGALGVALVVGAFGVLVSWYQQPMAATGITPRLHATVFPVTGLAAAGWALAGFGLGAVAGLLWRRVLPALATAFAAWFGLAFLGANVLRPSYLAPLTTTRLQLPATDLPIDRWWTKGGVRVGDAQLKSVLNTIGFQAPSGSGKITVSPGTGGTVDPVQYLLKHGYVQVTSYQPDSRYWPFQWIEFGWLVALSAVLLTTALWLLRRRPA